MQGRSRVLGAAVLGLAVVLMLSGCGRRNPPDPPGGAPVVADPVDPNKATGDQGEAARRSAPKKKFILDPLL